MLKHKRHLVSLLLPILWACSEQYQLDHVKEAWDKTNHPALMDVDYLTNEKKYILDYHRLPLTARLPEVPWTTSYWPTYTGGISYRWADPNGYEAQIGYTLSDYATVTEYESIKTMSPAEKFDIYTGDAKLFPIIEMATKEKIALTLKDFLRPDARLWMDQVEWVNLTQYERVRTRITKTIPEQPDYDEDFEIPSWEGLCHAWAPASFTMKEPRPVELKNKAGTLISFGASDVKALTTFFYHFSPAETSFLGGRCNISFATYRSKVLAGEMTQDEFDKLIDSLSCRDTNAGAFHVVLTNQIGLMQQGFVADLTRDAEVWNHPVYGYDMEVISSHAIESPEDRKRLNAAATATEVVEIQATMDIVSERMPGWEIEAPLHTLQTRVYSYRLELNSEGIIVGGEWLQPERPDFLWKQKQPAYVTGTNAFKEIYEASIAGAEES